MSADNYIFLDRKTKEVFHCTASCVCSHKRHCFECQKSLIGKAKTLSQAMKMAEQEDTEYGLYTVVWCK